MFAATKTTICPGFVLLFTVSCSIPRNPALSRTVMGIAPVGLMFVTVLESVMFSEPTTTIGELMFSSGVVMFSDGVIHWPPWQVAFSCASGGGSGQPCALVGTGVNVVTAGGGGVDVVGGALLVVEVPVGVTVTVVGGFVAETEGVGCNVMVGTAENVAVGVVDAVDAGVVGGTEMVIE
jgi:hypothetical protein